MINKIYNSFKKMFNCFSCKINEEEEEIKKQQEIRKHRLSILPFKKIIN